MLDIDQDGKLSREEYQVGFSLMDLNHDGFIDEEEFNALPGCDFGVLDDEREDDETGDVTATSENTDANSKQANGGGFLGAEPLTEQLKDTN